MSIFGSILNSIFHHSSANAQAATGQAPASSGTGQATAGGASQQSAYAAPAGQQGANRPASASTGSTGAGQSPAAASGSTAGQQRLQDVDVEAVLSKLAASKGGGGNWRTSIVDLLKLLDLDSSLTARKELANELGVHAGADGSAEQNIALQKAVMRKLAENGGKVPDSLRS